MNQLLDIFNNFLNKHHFYRIFYNELNKRQLKLENYNYYEIDFIFNDILSCNLTTTEYIKWKKIFNYWNIEILKNSTDFHLLIRFLKENNLYKDYINNVNLTFLSRVNLTESVSSIISSLNFEELNNNIWISLQLKWNIMIARKSYNKDIIDNFINYIQAKNYNEIILKCFEHYKKSYQIYNINLLYKDFLFIIIKYPSGYYKDTKGNIISIQKIVGEFLIHNTKQTKI